jgi:hypothetical protein
MMMQRRHRLAGHHFGRGHEVRRVLDRQVSTQRLSASGAAPPKESSTGTTAKKSSSTKPGWRADPAPAADARLLTRRTAARLLEQRARTPYVERLPVVELFPEPTTLSGSS